jgi:CBS domain-containing protein
MRAGELARAYPVISVTSPAAEAGRMLAQEDIDVLLVQGTDGVPVGALHDIGLLTAMLPHYLVEDRALARVVGEGDAAALWSRLEGKTVADLLQSNAAPLPTVPQDATLVQVAAEMCATGAALVAVVDGDQILGGVTTSALLTQLLARP